MNISQERKAINDALDNYRARLDAIPDELFSETPPGGGWSYAEVYSHIFPTTLASFIGLERCTYGNCAPTSKGINFFGRIVMFLGLLPVKLKVLPAVAAKMPVTKITKEEARNLIIKCRKRVDNALPLIKTASSHSRYKHPRFGMLNAAQWFKFIRIHLQHHLKQLDRINSANKLKIHLHKGA